jgi:hypothetical protein
VRADRRAYADALLAAGRGHDAGRADRLEHLRKAISHAGEVAAFTATAAAHERVASALVPIGAGALLIARTAR